MQIISEIWNGSTQRKFSVSRIFLDIDRLPKWTGIISREKPGRKRLSPKLGWWHWHRPCPWQEASRTLRDRRLPPCREECRVSASAWNVLGAQQCQHTADNLQPRWRKPCPIFAENKYRIEQCPIYMKKTASALNGRKILRFHRQWTWSRCRCYTESALEME